MSRFLVPLVLATIALILGATGLLLLPHAQELPTPRPVTVAVQSQEQPSVVTYAVTHLHGSDYRLKVGVGIFTPHIVVNTPVALQVTLPVGVATNPCLRPYCSAIAGISVLNTQRVFTRPSLSELTIPIIAREFGYTANGTNASVVMPEVLYNGPGTPKLVVHYQLPSASGYDWASFPTVYASTAEATWYEEIVAGQVATRTAIGINHAQQEHDSFLTFLAGALIALAGGALIAAVQELLHGLQHRD